MDIFNKNKIINLENKISQNEDLISSLTDQINENEKVITQLKKDISQLKGEIDILIKSNDELQVKNLDYISGQVSKITPNIHEFSFILDNYNDFAISSINSTMEILNYNKIINSYDLFDIKEININHKIVKGGSSNNEYYRLYFKSLREKNTIIKQKGNSYDVEETLVSYIYKISSSCSKRELKIGLLNLYRSKYPTNIPIKEIFKVNKVSYNDNHFEILGKIKTMSEVNREINNFYMKSMRRI